MPLVGLEGKTVLAFNITQIPFKVRATEIQQDGRYVEDGLGGSGRKQWTSPLG